MIEIMNHLRIEGTDVLFYGEAGYFMFILIMFFAIVGVLSLIKLLLKFHKCVSEKVEGAK